MQYKTQPHQSILIVDDEPLVISMIKRVLEDEGYTVLSAGDGTFALSLVRECDPDLILLDILMPGVDGITTLERIRDISSAPVIMITGLRNDELLKRSFDSGADDFVKKPFRMKELIARIQTKLRRN